MRVLVTGSTNPTGKAIVKRLAAAGHKVRAFGVEPGDATFAALENVKSFPGWVHVAGSIEPVLAEREALVHAACLDAPTKDTRKSAVHILDGTRFTVYAAEREQVDHFIHVTPAQPGRVYADVQAQATALVHGLRGDVNIRVVEAGPSPDDVAADVESILAGLPMLGTIVGGNDNAVTE